ncbi:MAG: efflux RND transporter periplasmic adaptor subunit, partial [Planctomycetota bacterium]|nr:efflux RND transporter periplasmic adaptor subunit [Planctomycetota bacterium]
IGLLMERVTRRSLTRRLQVLGEVEAPRHGQAVVSAPLAGRLLPPESGQLPRVGEQVAKGQMLGYLEVPLTASDAAQLVANEMNRDALEMELLVREFDLEAKALEIDQALHQAQARLAFARQALARSEGLRQQGLGTVTELEENRRDLELALSADAGAQALKESFTGAEGRISSLRIRSLGERSNAKPHGLRRHALVAPLAGEIVEAEYVEGEYIESQGAVYRVLDASRVWIAAHISEFDLAEVGAAPGALIEFAAFPGRTFDVLGAMGGRVISAGRIVDPQTRTIALRYEADNPEGVLRVGMFADVFLETGRAVDAIAVPEEALVMDNGRPVAFVLVHGEMFQKRSVELGIRDGGFVEVLAGIEEGERVVTKGAYLVRLASASPASFGAGHAH